MSASTSDPLWPRSFWSDVPDADRAALREVLAELLGRGVLLGDEGSGRELYMLARDHYRTHVEDYLAPLALELIVDDENSMLQARPRTESCLLLGRFDKDETLVLLALWRLYDDEISSGSQEAVIVTVDQLWAALKVYFDKVATPEKSQIESCLVRLRRHRLVRTLKPEGMTQAGEMQIEILPSLSRVIPFDDIAAWQARAETFQPPKDGSAAEEVPA
ncbi:MAG: DUF4194 domain-containing protein [Prosthecobacter sp.]|uniref:DUF4194 domain-containing protein n=1 Tax=Prosthecobacter sp. TaxID=1965333 RepID=UPI003BB195EC